MEIKTIDELILALNTCVINKTENCYLDAMKSLQIPLNEWERYFTFREDRPGRVCLSTTESYQLFLLCYEKGQQGPIHDIDSEEAWIHPICGEFIEERYRESKGKMELEQVSSVLLNSQSYSHMQKSKTIYRYINAYENRSVCLHLYSKPVMEWREYDNNTGRANLIEHPLDVMVDE
jgi:cysteine dioxygenase